AESAQPVAGTAVVGGRAGPQVAAAARLCAPLRGRTRPPLRPATTGGSPAPLFRIPAAVCHDQPGACTTRATNAGTHAGYHQRAACARSHFPVRRLMLARLSSTPQRRTMKTIQDALPLSGHPFTRRHIGPGPEEAQAMLEALGYTSLDALIEDAIPSNIRFRGSLSVGETMSELEALNELRAHAERNHVLRSFIGLGYHDTF